jgi:hypothetical protein
MFLSVPEISERRSIPFFCDFSAIGGGDEFSAM